MARRKIGDLIKEGLRRAYKAKTSPLQAGSKVANRIAPKSKIATALAALATPAILNPSSGTKAPANKPQPPRKQKEQGINKKKSIKGSSSNKRGTFTSRKRTGEGDQGNFNSVMPTMGMPGQDMMAPMPTRSRARRMKAGGLAIKGQGKAFLKSKR